MLRARFLPCIAALVAIPASAQSVDWITQDGTFQYEDGVAVAPDASGGAFWGGETSGSWASPTAGAWDCWLARVSSAGDVLWVRQFGTTPDDVLSALAADGVGGVFAAGTTQGLLGSSHAGGGDAWIARYNADGQRLWIRQIGTRALDEANALVADGSGGVLVGGATTGSLAAQNGGDRDIWLARYDAAGTQLWLTQHGGADTEEAHALALDGAGGVYVGGFVVHENAPPDPLGRDGFLARHDSAGHPLWSLQIGVPGIFVLDRTSALAADGQGGVLVGGSTSGALGGMHAGGTDAWIARYDASGSQTWIRQLGTPGSDAPSCMVPDGAGGLWVAGQTDGGLGGGHAGTADAWLGRFDAGGNQLALQNFGTHETEWARALAVSPAGHLFAVGSAWGSLGGPGSHLGQVDAWIARFDQPQVQAYCFGDGSGVACPCGNNSASGRGCANGSGAGAKLVSSGSTSLSAGDLVLSGSYLPPTTLGVYVQATGTLNAGLGQPFANGLLCIGGGLVRLQIAGAGAAGTSLTTLDLGSTGGPLAPGDTRRYQLWYRDPTGPCGAGANLTNALEITWVP